MFRAQGLQQFREQAGDMGTSGSVFNAAQRQDANCTRCGSWWHRAFDREALPGRGVIVLGLRDKDASGTHQGLLTCTGTGFSRKFNVVL